MKADLRKAQINIIAESSEGKIIASSVLEREESNLAEQQKEALYQWLSYHGVLVVDSTKEALYHSDKGRKYRPNREELKTGEFLCPGCKVVLRKTVYKLRTPLFTCPECNWSIRRDDIWSPEPEEEPAIRGPGEATSSWLDH